MKFSERMGTKPIKVEFQKGSIERSRFANILMEHF